MWKYVKFILGIFLIVISIGGFIAMGNGSLEESGRRIVEGGVNTDGKVVKRTRHIVAGRWGKIGAAGVYYTMEYTFTTLEGKKYSGEINVSKDQAYSVNDGETIRIRYFDKQPSINAPLRFKDYMSRRDAENAPYGLMITTSIMTLLGGAWLTWANWRRIRPAQGSSVATSRMATARQAGIAGPSGPPAGNTTGAVARSGGFGRR